MTFTYRNQIRPQLARVRHQTGAVGYKYVGWRWFISEESAFLVRSRMGFFGGMAAWVAVEEKMNA